MGSKSFTVLISGGGIAGLTLANLLERVGIAYVILEAYSEIAPQVGASIGILPNGGRIYDQIGIYDDIRALIDGPLDHNSVRHPGAVEITQYDGLGDQVVRRFGYDTIFVDRQMVLKVLWENLKHKDKIFLNKQVAKVALEPSGVKVTTSDGETFSGDILVGADGVHSKVRGEMWRLADTLQPGYIPASEHTECLPTVYKCIFGISICKDFIPHMTQTNMHKHFSYLVIGGPDGRVYWFLFVNLGETQYGPDLPRYTKEDEQALANEHLDDLLGENFTFRDLYDSKISSLLTSLPEYVFKKWHFNRIITIGDAAHKMEPIAGQGGNSAIETAAVLVNNLVLALKSHPDGLNTADVDAVFAETQAKREPRVRKLLKASNEEQQFCAMETPLLRIMGKILVPLLSIDAQQDQWYINFEEAHKLDLLDVPERPRAIPFFDELPHPRWESSNSVSLLVGAALCGIFYVAQKVLVINPDVSPTFGTYLGGELRKHFTGIPQLDEILSTACWALSQSVSGPDPNWILQHVYLLTNMLPVIYIWTVEGYRNGNHLTLLSFPALFAAASALLGIGKVAPLYYLFSLFSTGRGVYTRPTGRPIPSTVASTLLPALCIGYVLPTALVFLPYGDDAVQQAAIAFWVPSPLYVSLLALLFSKVLQRIAPVRTLDWEIFENRDLPSLQTGYAFSFCVAAVVHACAIVYGSLSPAISLWCAFFDIPSFATADLKIDMGAFMKYDLLLLGAAVVLWCLYSAYELRRLGYVSTKAAVGAGAAVLAGQVVVGPGATYAGLWAWREGVVAGLMKN
ncbi:FAD binding domain-containing protein [Colletotrichum plurivorum]|uniref:FAD binding domain-containing protein n=1 Tax=Colletotrichum plurivorum TaxID=2175906 RepID=A0A8H6K2Y1_9PEZI|nr:FAD binding domain-containing protein [Colletotrichum plurivorum]